MKPPYVMFPRKKALGLLIVGMCLLFPVSAAYAQGPAEPSALPDASQDHSSRLLAVAGEEFISVGDFLERYRAYLNQTGQKDRFFLRRQVLDHMVDVLLVVQENASNPTLSTAYRKQAEKARKKLLLGLYAQRVLFDTLKVTEVELREAYYRLHTEVNARHLYASTHEEAAQLYARLQNGASFDALARETFKDSHLAEKGGRLGWFSFTEMDPAFEDVAYMLEVGEISKPIRTSQGYFIVQVLERRTKPFITESEYARKKDGLRILVETRKRAAVRRARTWRILDELNVTFHESALTSLYNYLQGAVITHHGEQAEAWLQQPLVTFGGGAARVTWTIADVHEQAQQAAIVNRKQIGRTVWHVRAFIEGLLVREEIARRAREINLHETPFYEEELRDAMRQWLYHEVREQIADDEEDAEAFQRYLEALRSRYEVSIYEKRLARLSLLTS